MSTPAETHIVEANKQYASTYNSGGLALPPAKKATIVTCMDARLNPSLAYGIPLGDINVIRNAGASAKDALRSLIISNHILGTEEVFIIKHTRCGLLGATNEMGRGAVKQNLGISSDADIDNYDFIPIADVEKSAKEDVEFYKSHKFTLPNIKVSGWVHDTDTGLLKKVAE